MTPEQQAFLDQYLQTLTPNERQAIPQTLAEYFAPMSTTPTNAQGWLISDKNVLHAALRKAIS